MPTKHDNRAASKKSVIEALLLRRNGASIAEMIKATGWQSHSVRAAISRLRRPGQGVERFTTKSGAGRYRIVRGHES